MSKHISQCGVRSTVRAGRNKDQVKWTTLFVGNYGNIPRLYQESDIWVSSNKWLGFSNQVEEGVVSMGIALKEAWRSVKGKGSEPEPTAELLVWPPVYACFLCKGCPCVIQMLTSLPSHLVPIHGTVMLMSRISLSQVCVNNSYYIFSALSMKADHLMAAQERE